MKIIDCGIWYINSCLCVILECFVIVIYNICAVDYISSKETYLKAIGERLELHSTFSDYKNSSDDDLHIVNHGIVGHVELSQ